MERILTYLRCSNCRDEVENFTNPQIHRQTSSLGSTSKHGNAESDVLFNFSLFDLDGGLTPLSPFGNSRRCRVSSVKLLQREDVEAAFIARTARAS